MKILSRWKFIKAADAMRMWMESDGLCQVRNIPLPTDIIPTSSFTANPT